MKRFSTSDSEIEVTDSKLESSTEDAIATLAELREAQSSLGVSSSSGTECDSDIQNSQLIKENSATHEELTDKNEKSLDAENAPNDDENIEADHCEAHSIKSVEDEDYDDCLSDTLQIA
ncbi:uncharacterized protein LOC109532778 [Dendroctonus ponderosae]|uniref:uncharacterized protein LOC109532778 n=1 Tax=Dendroctonus ponderosae TaxID=77166 RepID=UPI0020351B7C|nr:uncharacterized protein LOC109532778 [Dendroctonus ponderosae]